MKALYYSPFTGCVAVELLAKRDIGLSLCSIIRIVCKVTEDSHAVYRLGEIVEVMPQDVWLHLRHSAKGFIILSGRPNWQSLPTQR